MPNGPPYQDRMSLTLTLVSTSRGVNGSALHGCFCRRSRRHLISEPWSSSAELRSCFGDAPYFAPLWQIDEMDNRIDVPDFRDFQTDGSARFSGLEKPRRTGPTPATSRTAGEVPADYVPVRPSSDRRTASEGAVQTKKCTATAPMAGIPCAIGAFRIRLEPDSGRRGRPPLPYWTSSIAGS